jgi:hypothetical protein
MVDLDRRGLVPKWVKVARIICMRTQFFNYSVMCMRCGRESIGERRIGEKNKNVTKRNRIIRKLVEENLCV